MSVYRWHDPTLPVHIGRTWLWVREFDKVTADAPVRGCRSKRPNMHMEWTWTEWCEIAVCAGSLFEEGRYYQYRSDGRYVAFGWEMRARRDYQQVMHIRGYWDGVELLAIEMPEAHWGDVLGCMEIQPPREGETGSGGLVDEREHFAVREGARRDFFKVPLPRGRRVHVQRAGLTIMCP